MPETYNIIVRDENGIVDRFATVEEARAAYPNGEIVAETYEESVTAEAAFAE